MTLPVREVSLGLAAPAAASVVVWFVVRKCISSDVAQRHAASLAFGVGTLLGVALLNLTPVQPTSHWHWLPYMLLLSMTIGPIADADGVHWLERALLFGSIAVIGGLVLAPTWDNVTPSRPTQFGIWVGAVMVVSLTCHELARRGGAVFVTCMMFSAGSGAVVLVLSGNMRLAQELGAGASALAGLVAALYFTSGGSKSLGISLPAAVFILGCLWTGQVNSFSDVPLICYLLPAAAPLTQVVVIRGVPGLSSRAADIVRLILVAVTGAVAVTVAALYG